MAYFNADSTKNGHPPAKKPIKKGGPLSAVGYLLISLPLTIISFSFTVAFTLLGIALTPVGIGIPILYFALFAADRFLALDAQLLFHLNKDADTVPVAAFKKFRLRAMIQNVTLYAPVMYQIAKLPISILQFATAAVLSAGGFALLFTPAVYLVLQHAGIDMFQDDRVMSALFPNLTPYQWSFFGTGLGVIFLLAGFYAAAKWIRFGWIMTHSFAVRHIEEEPQFAAAYPQQPGEKSGTGEDMQAFSYQTDAETAAEPVDTAPDYAAAERQFQHKLADRTSY